MSLEQDLSKLLEDRQIEDICINPRGIFFFKNFQWQELSEKKPSDSFLRQLSFHIAEETSAALGQTLPALDSFLKTPSGEKFRAHIAIAPLAEKGTEITLRRLGKPDTLKLENFFENPIDAARLLEAFRQHASILVVGSTGSGKSTLLKCLLDLCHPSERVLILEDSPELEPPNPLSTRLLSRTNRFGFREGSEWGLSDLLYESLRMRPSRIVLGECRGAEAYAMAQALETGHRSIMATMHAGSVAQAKERFEKLVKAGAPSAQVSVPFFDICLVLKLQKNSHGQCERKIAEFYTTQKSKE